MGPGVAGPGRGHLIAVTGESRKWGRGYLHIGAMVDDLKRDEQRIRGDGEIARRRGRREAILEELSEINPTDPGNTRSFV